MSVLNFKFVQYKDIPKKGVLHKRLYVGYPLYVINKLYNICIDNLLHKDIDLTDFYIPELTSKDALKHFAMYDIVNDVNRVIDYNSMCKVYRPTKVHANIEEYINRVANRYFSKRYMQYDCHTVITAIKGELFNAYSQLGLQAPFKYFYDMRIMHMEKSTIILTELGMLNQLKREFKEVFNAIKQLLYILQEQMINVPVVEDDTGLDL